MGLDAMSQQRGYYSPMFTTGLRRVIKFFTPHRLDNYFYFKLARVRELRERERERERDRKRERERER